jgi:hypothetical protein
VLGAHEGSRAAAVLYAVALCLTSGSSAGYLWYASGRSNLFFAEEPGEPGWRGFMITDDSPAENARDRP